MLDAIVIGGGFYGTAIAAYLTRRRGLNQVLIIERESTLLSRASYNNQARIHNGYHYPRSFTTAFRSRANFPRFVHDYSEAVKHDFSMLYAIARRNSKVTSRQFERFCREIGARLEPAPQPLRALFESKLIEDVFLVEEYAFDATVLARLAKQELDAAGVAIQFNTRVRTIRKQKDSLVVECDSQNREVELAARLVFNCTYSGLNQFGSEQLVSSVRLKHEIAEIALVQAPKALSHLGITVMDGPFFSIMPFPARDLHALTHVRYTPHLHWTDSAGIDPYLKLANYDQVTRADRMIRDVSRYMPAILEARYVESLFEVKTVLVKNEGDDGRPILFERFPELPGCYSILGGKIDNIYDVIEMLDDEIL